MGWLDGKVAVVTGAGRGIGRAIALMMAQEGAKVVVNDPGVGPDGIGHDRGPADQVVEEIRSGGGEAVASYESVADFEAAGRIIGKAVEAFGRIDILVNNAGILRDRMVFNMTEEEWDAVIAVHLKGTFNCTRHASVLMRQQRFGRIINVSSISGLRGNSGQANYGAAKAGIAGFTRVVARDLGRYGVTCNCVAPRALTRLTAGVPVLAEAMKELKPEHIAPMVCYLASDAAWNINGQVFLVYGGTVALLHHPLPWRTIFKPGMWTYEEISRLMPVLLEGTRNPAPPPEDLEIPGRPRKQG
ncbi:MAG: SDR family oxidoreductase [Dehalococcoidia bacterium]|jgi:NAD(P)-dependent dehydrogenase (short-subunit alcohol dehydrogenase family)|nr:SDR family oxidoreductase [Dehalococcoidia bacterium]